MKKFRVSEERIAKNLIKKVCFLKILAYNLILPKTFPTLTIVVEYSKISLFITENSIELPEYLEINCS